MKEWRDIQSPEEMTPVGSETNSELLTKAENGDALHQEMAHRIRVLTVNLTQSEAREHDLVQNQLYLAREIQDLCRKVAALTAGSEDRRPNLSGANSLKTMNYPQEIWADTDLVCSDEPHENWQKYRRVDEPETPPGMKLSRVEMLDGKPVRCFIEAK